MELLDFLSPVGFPGPNTNFIARHVSFLSEKGNFSSFDGFKIALLGVPDDENLQSFEVAETMRKQLYQLVPLSNNITILDLGNIKTGHSLADTYASLNEVFSFIARHKLLAVVIGGKSLFMNGEVTSYLNRNLPLNMVSVDSHISPALFTDTIKDTEPDQGTTNKSVNFINVGYQSYFVPRATLDFIDDSYFEAYRLGYVRGNIKEIEPVLRDANLVSFSLNSVKHADAPGAINSSPNGLSGDEACQLAFYAGHSNRITSFGLFDLDLKNDINHTTAKLSAQILWYFFEGIANRILEEPDSKPQNFTKYLLHNNTSEQDLCFYKSNLTNRWWMEITYPAHNHQIVLSCSESDYELACKQDIPDRWWRTYQRTQLI